VEKPKGLEDWEKRLVENAENKRKATVAQLCKLEEKIRVVTPADKCRLLRVLLYVHTAESEPLWQDDDS
jgi:hypothetical protein